MDTCYQSWIYQYSIKEDEVWKQVDIRKRNHPILAENTTPELILQPPTALPIKKARLSDIKKQMRYIPEVYQGFYKKQMEMDVDSAHKEQQTDEDSDQEDLSVVLPVLAEHVQPSLMANTVLTTQTNVSARRTAKR